MFDARLTIKTPTGEHTFRVLAPTCGDGPTNAECRESLAADEGQVCLFQQHPTSGFWAQSAPIPLDILLIDDEMRVAAVLPEQAQSAPLPPVGRFVLELAAGEAGRRNITEGDSVSFEDFQLVDEHCTPSLESTRGGKVDTPSYRGAGVFSHFPVDATRAYVTSLFAAQEVGLRTSPHRGMDFGVPVGTPVLAPGDGVVESAFFDTGGGGNVLFLKHPNGLKTAYLHLSAFKVVKGQTVKAGDVVALSGNTGSSTGPHLHFEVRIPKAGGDTRLNPLDHLPGPVQLSTSLAAKMGVKTLAPAAGGLLSIGMLALVGYGAYRVGKAKGWI